MKQKNNESAVKQPEFYEFHGYRVTKDGNFYDENGKLLNVRKNGQIRLRIDGEKRLFTAARVVYEAVSGQTVGASDCTLFLNGDRTDIRYDNIKVKKRIDYFKTKKTGKDRVISEETAEQIIKEYNREERRKHGFKGPYKHPTYNELAQKYGCSKSTVTAIVDGVYFKRQRERTKKTCEGSIQR